MKKVYKYFGMALLTGVLVTSCDLNPENAVNAVLDEQTTGAVLRTINVNNSTLNSSNPDSFFSVTVEEQDEQDGGLFESVDVNVTFVDQTPDNGETVAEDVYVSTTPASNFTTGERGLPVGDVVVTYGEIASALGLNSSNVLPGDVLTFRLTVNLTDGRSFSNTNSGSNILGSAYFNSPFSYTGLVTCTPQFGDYLVVMHDAYGDGWQTTNPNGGPGLTIQIDDTEVQVGICTIWETPEYDCVPGNGSGDGNVPDSNIEATVTVPEGTELLTWTLPGDNWGEISFQIYAPNGDLLYDRQPGGDVGLLPVLLCL